MNNIFAEANRKLDKLYDELAASPIYELTGIVDPSGVGAAKSAGQELWSLLLTFEAWRISNESIRTDPLTIRRRVTEKELHKFQDLIKAETIILIRARIAENNVFGSPKAQIEDFVALDSTDAQLQRHLAQLQEPKIHEDNRFGLLTFDRRIDWYSAQVKWQGKTINLNLNVESADELDPVLKVAYKLWDNESTWSERINNYAIEKLLPLKNDNWLDGDEPELSVQEFKDRMTLEAVSVYPDGEFEFWHNDGDLFWGHSIQISGNLSEGPTRADIPG